jgi:hypothetical protein
LRFEFAVCCFFEKYKDIQWTTDYATEGRGKQRNMIGVFWEYDMPLNWRKENDFIRVDWLPGLLLFLIFNLLMLRILGLSFFFF